MRSTISFPTALCAAIGFAAVAAPSAEARSPVVIEGVDHDMRESLEELLPDREAPTTLFDAERIGEEAAEHAMAWLRSQGYYDAQVTPEANESPASARLIIAPGARYRFTAPELAFEGDAPSEAAASAARTALRPIVADQPARAADVLAAEAGALAALQDAGYADAVAGERRVVVDHATAQVSVHLVMHSGAFARLGSVRAEPDGVFRQSYLNHLRDWRTGAPYAPDRLARLRRDLASTGAVARVATRLDPPDPNGVRNVVLEIEPAKRNAYELGFGYSTTEGFGAEAEWTRRNISGRADYLTTSVTLGQQLSSIGVELVRPHGAGLGHAQHYGVLVAHEDIDAYTRDGAALFFSVDAASRLRRSLTYGARLSADRYDESSGVRNATVLSGFGDWRQDTTGAPLDPRHGHILDFRLEPSVSTGDATLGFLRTMADARIYDSYFDDDHLTLAARTRVGWVEPVSGSAEDIPPDRRFYAGGGGSVRGYAYNSIYPEFRKAPGITPGGQGALEVSAEARWRFDNGFGAVAFVDGGNAFDTWEDAADFRWGAGIGVRYQLGFAPLRVDIAVPLDRRDGDEDYALYISLGQAF